MRKYNPYRNIFYYYRGPSSKKEEHFDKQLEDNTTKALINTLESSEKRLLMSLLEKTEIDIKHLDRVAYDFQVDVESSRPDALIQIDNKYDILIESKVDARLEKDQICRHLESISNGYLICITPIEGDKNVVQQINKANLRFITWKEVYLCFNEQLGETKDKISRFLIEEFLKYLELIGTAPFDGWNEKDFQAFEDDHEGELRRRVKRKLEQYLIELNELLKREKIFEDLEVRIGRVYPENENVWGLLYKLTEESLVDQPNFRFSVEHDIFSIGVEAEGKKPTESLRKRIESEKDKFLKIFTKLNGFYLSIFERERVIPRQYVLKYDTTEELELGDTLTSEKIDRLMEKTREYGLFAIHCGREFRKKEKILDSSSFLKESMECMKQLREFYNFAWDAVSNKP